MGMLSGFSMNEQAEPISPHPRTSPLVEKRRKRVRGKSRSLTSSPLVREEIAGVIKGNDFTFNIVAMPPLDLEQEEMESEGMRMLLLDQIDSEEERAGGSSLESPKRGKHEEEEAMRQLDETRATEAKHESVGVVTCEQSIESREHATPQREGKYSDDKRVLSTIKQEPPTEQRAHSELTTEQKLEAGPTSPKTARQNYAALERNLMEEIKHIATAEAMGAEPDNKENYPTPKPYSHHIVRNSLKQHEVEDDDDDEILFEVEHPIP